MPEPIENLRAAVKALRDPFHCWPRQLAEPVADLLDLIADQYEREPCDDPTGVCNRCEFDPTILAADLVADAINGGHR